MENMHTDVIVQRVNRTVLSQVSKSLIDFKTEERDSVACT